MECPRLLRSSSSSSQGAVSCCADLIILGARTLLFPFVSHIFPLSRILPPSSSSYSSSYSLSFRPFICQILLFFSARLLNPPLTNVGGI